MRRRAAKRRSVKSGAAQAAEGHERAKDFLRRPRSPRFSMPRRRAGLACATICLCS